MKRNAFSLVELSIVLVILGLLVGGILSGKSLIEAASLKSQISQIDSYRVATMAFKDKYFYLPGDLINTTATSAGFTTRNGARGRGDGDGLIEGINTAGTGGPGREMAGETALFWSDLSKAGLIAGSFTTADALPASSTPYSNISTPGLKDFYPTGKLSNSYVYVSALPGFSMTSSPSSADRSRNYLFLSPLDQSTSAGMYMTGALFTIAPMGLKVSQAYGIDTKADDGNPLTGKVMALYTEQGVSYWSSPAGYQLMANTYIPTVASATACFDNNNTNTPPTYSMAYQDGSAPACGLAFPIQ